MRIFHVSADPVLKAVCKGFSPYAVVAVESTVLLGFCDDQIQNRSPDGLNKSVQLSALRDDRSYSALINLFELRVFNIAKRYQELSTMTGDNTRTSI